MIRVLIAEDSLTTRQLLVEIFRGDPQFVVAGEAKDGVEAVEMTRSLRPDVVTMDIWMPLLDGFEATRRIMVEAPTPIVIVSGSRDVAEVAVSMHALRAGALAVLQKPRGPDSPGFEESCRQFLATVKAMSQVKVVRRWPERVAPAAPAGTHPSLGGGPVRIVAMAASTGGPAALHRVLSTVPGGFPVPILAVQHIAPGFIDGFAVWLNAVSSLPVRVAANGEGMLPGTVYLAPDGRHLGVADRTRLLVSEAPPIDGFRPSATFLYESVARTFGASTVAVILSGMGRDGVDGLRSVQTAGGRVIAQDEATSVVFGMPGAAVEAGVADAVLPLDAIGYRLGEIIRNGEGSAAR